MTKVRIGTRGSQLALWQADKVALLIKKQHPGTITDLVKIKTTGDKILDSPLSKIGDKGLFVKEIENALIKREIDIAVHSAKDMPTEIPAGLILTAYLKRDDPSDALISADGRTLDELREGAVIGTSSLRRRAQLLAYRPDLRFVDLRGNVDTRLRKLKEEKLDAILLSGAGLTRLGMGDKITERIPASIVVPAVGQGLIVIEAREEDRKTLDFVEFMNDRDTAVCVKAERAFSDSIGGGCQVPMGALAVLEDGTMKLKAVVASLDGETLLRAEIDGPAEDGEALGRELAERMKDMGAAEILDEIRRENC
ncbi:MAG: hydroxymethylbilane synthase [Actinomycetota bacterium]